MDSYRDLYVTVEGAELSDIETALDTIVDGYEFYKITSDDCLHCNVSSHYDYDADFSTLSKQFPRATITLEIHPEEIYFNGISRVYYCNGLRQEVEAEINFPACTLVQPVTEYRTINVVLMGREIPVEVELLNSTTEDEAYQIAKEQLKRLL